MVACRHQRGQPCACRKPSGGLLERARDELGLDLHHAWLIGDEGDVTAGRAKALRTIRVGPSDTERSGPTVAPDYEARDLLDAANWILLQEALAVA
jgi:histidinol phosphatase-like enzyme